MRAGSLIIALFVIGTGCQQQELPVTVAAQTIDELPPELAAAARENSQRQAAAGSFARVTIHKAGTFTGRTFEIGEEAQAVSVDLTLTVNNPKGGFDLDDIAFVDADTGEDFGSDPLIQRLTGNGEPADFDDPVFGGETSTLRLVLVHVIPKTTKRLHLEYWDTRLTTAPVVLSGAGPGLPPKPRTTPIHFFRHPEGPVAKYDRYLAVLEVQHGARSMSPDYYSLRALQGEEEVLGSADRLVEVDSMLAVDATPLEKRPFLVPSRRFLVEYWVPKGATVLDLNEFGSHHALPKLAPGTVIPKATLTALEAAKPLSSARHR